MEFINKDKKRPICTPFQNKMIGLFLGSTDFPKLILNKIKKIKKNYFIIDLTLNNKFKIAERNSHANLVKFYQ